MENDKEPEYEYPRLRDLPEEERIPFEKWNYSSTRPLVMGVKLEDQDFYYPWDYAKWKLGMRQDD